MNQLRTSREGERWSSKRTRTETDLSGNDEDSASAGAVVVSGYLQHVVWKAEGVGNGLAEEENEMAAAALNSSVRTRSVRSAILGQHRLPS
jgi:hypothetical protein